MEKRLKPNNKLRAYWSKKENDVMYYYPKCGVDGSLLHHFFSYVTNDFGDGQKTFLDELDRRGFDLTTLKFSIAYKEERKAK